MQDLRIHDAGQIHVWFPMLPSFAKEFCETMHGLAATAEACRHALESFGRGVDRAAEIEYREAHGRKPPGSWRTRRLAKKRRKAIHNLCGEEPLKG